MTKIYHNPRCRKSREALELLQAKNEDIEIIKYLEEPLSKTSLKALIELLGIRPIQLVRKGESVWKSDFKDKELSDSEVIDALLKHPKLMERPIVVKNKKAVIGRPLEDVLTIL